jgi:uncharacterized protein YggE
MKWLVGAVSAAFALLAVALFTSTSQSQPAKEGIGKGRMLTASGTGTTKVDADAARITVRIEASGQDLKSARDALDKKAAKLKDALDGLKLGIEVRAQPIEIQQQAFGGGFGGGPFNPPMAIPGGPVPLVPPAAPAPLPVNPPQLKRPVDGFLVAPAPERPARGEAAPNPPFEKPPEAAPPGIPQGPPAIAPVPPALPAPPVGGIGGGVFQPPMGIGGGNFQVSQALIVTLKNADYTKLLDGVNKTLTTAAENGVGVGNPNNFGAIGFGGGGGGFGGFRGGFQGIMQNQTGPSVTFQRTDDKEARRKALEAAVADAMANAKVMAKGANVTIVDTIAICDPPVSHTGQPISDFRSAMNAENTTGEMEITVKVTVICSY